MTIRKILVVIGVPVAFALPAQAANVANMGLIQAQAAIEDAGAIMDGTAQAPSFSRRAAVAANASQTSVEKKLERARAQFGRQGNLTARIKRPEPKSPVVKPATPEPKPGLLANVQNTANKAYKWMLRNPVETGFAVGIPATFFFGAAIGGAIGTAVCFFLRSRVKQPF